MKITMALVVLGMLLLCPSLGRTQELIAGDVDRDIANEYQREHFDTAASSNKNADDVENLSADWADRITSVTYQGAPLKETYGH